MSAETVEQEALKANGDSVYEVRVISLSEM